MMRRVRHGLVWSATTAMLALAAPALAAAPNVVVTIKPVHALVAGVMGDSGSPILLVDGANSPHTFRLKPSDATALQTADLVVRVGAGLELFLARPLAAITPGTEVLTLSEAAGMALLPPRGSAIWTDPADDQGDGHGHDAGSGIDPHLWLDPDNARAAVAAIATALIRLDPGGAETYAANAATLDRELIGLDRDLAAELGPVRHKPFIVFHDGYQYLEVHFGLTALGAVAINPERRPGAAHLKAIQAAIRSHDVGCVFAEPQFEPRLITAVVGDAPTRFAVLDPLGADLPAGQGHYAAMMRRNVQAISRCLAEQP